MAGIMQHSDKVTTTPMRNNRYYYVGVVWVVGVDCGCRGDKVVDFGVESPLSHFSHLLGHKVHMY